MSCDEGVEGNAGARGPGEGIEVGGEAWWSGEKAIDEEGACERFFIFGDEVRKIEVSVYTRNAVAGPE